MFRFGIEKPTIFVSPLNSPFRTNCREAFFDIGSSLRFVHTWLVPAFRDIKHQYRRTYLGPWWLTLSSFLTLLTLAALRHAVNPDVSFNQTLSYVGLGWILFGFLTSPISRATSIFFVGSSHASHATPVSSIAFRAVAVGFIDFGHEFVGLILLLTLSFSLDANIFVFFLMLPLMLVGNFGLTLWLGCLACRFRDIVPMVSLFLKVQMFLTPIFWSLNDVSQESVLARLSAYNPLTYLIVLMRDEVLGTSEQRKLPINPYVVVCVYVLGNLLIGLLTFGYARKRLVYWTETL